jgi:hypothetical protein
MVWYINQEVAIFHHLFANNLPLFYSTMSAYGAIASSRPNVELPVLSYPLPQDLALTTYPVHGSDVPPELISYLADVFNQELAGEF